MLASLPYVAATLYLAAAALLSRRLFGAPGASRNLPLVVATLAVAAHSVPHLHSFSIAGPDLRFFSTLSLVALIVAALTTVVSWWRGTEAIGIVAYPIAAAAAIGTRLHANLPPAPPAEWQISLHVVLALLAISVLAIAALVAIMLAVQEHALRTHKVAPLLRGFPPLTLVEALLFHLITGGFVLLTVTVLTGALFIHDWFAQHLVHKTVFTLAAWLVFGFLLFGRWRWGWRGRRAARLTVAGIVLLVVGFFGSKFVLEVLLGRG